MLTLMDGYLGWQDDVKATGRGNKIVRVLNEASGNRYIVQILPYILTENKPAGYVILIQTVDGKRSDK